MTETQLKQHPVILTRTGAVNQRLLEARLQDVRLARLYDQAAGGRDARCEAFFRPFGY